MSFWRWSAIALLSTALTMAGLLVLDVDFEKLKWWQTGLGMLLVFIGSDLWPTVTTVFPKSWLPSSK